jgi:hypothetical protein
MSPIEGNFLQSDALALLGITGDLACRMTFPALYAMTKRGGSQSAYHRRGLLEMDGRAAAQARDGQYISRSFPTVPIQPPTIFIGYSTAGTVGELRVQPARITTRAHISTALADSRLRVGAR